MLAVVVAAAFAPNTGVVQAQTNSGYPAPSVTPVSPYVYLGIAAGVIVAGLLVALLVLSRRRRKPPTAEGAPVQPWQEGPPGPAGGPPGAPPAAAPAYLETPEDVGHPPPVVPAAKPPPPSVPAGAAAPAAGEGEPDIDSLMAELDKISGEILKRAPKKGAPPPPEETGEDTSR